MKTIINICVLIGFVFTAYFYVEHRYALAENLKQVEQSMKYMQTEQQFEAVQDRVWKILDRYECETEDLKTCGVAMPNTVKEEFRELLEKKKKFIDRLNETEKK